MLKAGDRARIKDGSKISVIPATLDPSWNAAMTKAVGFVGVLKDVSKAKAWFRVEGSPGNFVYHRDWLEPVATLTALNDELVVAEAEVARIKAAIVAETHPKAGDVWKSEYGETTVVFVDAENVYYIYTSKGGGRPIPSGRGLKAFMAEYKKVDKT